MSVLKDMRPRGIVKESQAAPQGACTGGWFLERGKDEVGRAGWRRISWSLPRLGAAGAQYSEQPTAGSLGELGQLLSPQCPCGQNS